MKHTINLELKLLILLAKSDKEYLDISFKKMFQLVNSNNFLITLKNMLKIRVKKSIIIPIQQSGKHIFLHLIGMEKKSIPYMVIW